MFEGDLIEGELEIGQVAAQIDKITPAAAVLAEFVATYNASLSKMKPLG